MKAFHWLRLLLAAMSAIAFGATAAQAQLTFTLTPAVQNAAAGTAVIYSGTLTNGNGTSSLYLNNISFSVSAGSSASVSFNSNTFFSNVPGILLPGESYTGPIFSIALAANAAPTDYAGTVSILGGANIFAVTPQAQTNFTILSPSISISAASASVSEYGPTAGSIVIARTGSAAISLPVAFTWSGTAIQGSHYQPTASPVTIATGASTATVTITPITDQIAEGDRTILFNLAPSANYNLGSSASVSLTEHDLPIDQWRLATYGTTAANTTIAADDYQPYSDGITNLMAYALGINPLSPRYTLLPAAAVSGSYLTLSYTPNPSASDVAFVVEGSTDLTNWSATNVSLNAGSAPGSLIYQYNTPVGAVPQAFLRLRLARRASP